MSGLTIGLLVLGGMALVLALVVALWPRRGADSPTNVAPGPAGSRAAAGERNARVTPRSADKSPPAHDNTASPAKQTDVVASEVDAAGEDENEELSLEPDALQAALTRQREQGASDEQALDAVFDRYEDADYSVEDVLEGLAAAGITPSQLGSSLLRRGTSSAEATALIAFLPNISAAALVNCFLPTFPGDAKEQAQAFLGAYEAALEDDMNDVLPDEPAIVAALAEHGCSTAFLIAALYQRLGEDRTFDEMLDQFPQDAVTPEALGAECREQGVPLGHESVKALLEVRNAAFVCAFIRAYGWTAHSAADIASDYGVEMDMLLPALLAAGYERVAAVESIARAYEVGDAESAFDLIEIAHLADIPGADIFTALRNALLDPEAFDDELREKAVDIRTRVALLHALLFPQASSAASDTSFETPASSEAAAGAPNVPQ